MTNKKSQRNQRRNRKHRTLRGGGLFDGWFGKTEQPVPSSEPKKSWFEGWFVNKPAATTMTTNPVAEKKTDVLNPPASEATEPKPALNAAATGQPGPATGGKRRNKTEKNKNKNRKNKH